MKFNKRIILMFSVLVVSTLFGCSKGDNALKGISFNNESFIYDGTSHSLEATGLKEEMTVRYEGNNQINAGKYDVKAKFYSKSNFVGSLSAKLTIEKRNAKVNIDDQISDVKDIKELTYTTENVVDGDDLGVELFVAPKEGVQEITGTWSNSNYNVEFSEGVYIFTEALFDSSSILYDSPYLPAYAPFALYDTSCFSNSVITSISFPYYGLVSGYTVSSNNLFMPVYVVKKDFSTSREECMVENGKKINLDFTGKLDNVKTGDWITANNLFITVGKDETLAFGDEDMVVLPGFSRATPMYGFWNQIFKTKGANNYSLLLDIHGYSLEDKQNEEKVNISFLGDSITTYSGWSNSTSYNSTLGSNAIWFPNNNYVGANMSVSETWWYRTATSLNYDICVNNSYSGSTVKDAYTYNTRAANLHNNVKNSNPDVIVILMGVNDYAANIAIGNYDGTIIPTTITDFSSAYVKMLDTIKKNYPEADIYCSTFLPDRKRFSGSVNGLGIDEKDYNQAIKNIATNMHVNIIDLYNNSGITPEKIDSYTVDRLHPNSEGMRLMSEAVVSAILNH